MRFPLHVMIIERELLSGNKPDQAGIADLRAGSYYLQECRCNRFPIWITSGTCSSKEFDPIQRELKLNDFHTHDGVNYSLLIRPPMVLSLGTKKQVKIAVMGTKRYAPMPVANLNVQTKDQPMTTVTPLSMKAETDAKISGPLPTSAFSSSPACYAQVIECWWPKSQNSTIKAGLSVLPPVWEEKDPIKRSD
jgi:hypothetical protein